ncbi:MAG: ergothioneine biosynthesis protein EgtB [Solirubrobacterales bacterium]|nr:ergothioneine biosynthesis protein EgtB [Solirubrobacterales bacterium]
MAAQGSPSTLRPEAEDLAAVRAATLALVGHLERSDLERVLDPLMSPLVWDLAHIAAYEDLWIAHRVGGLELLHPELAAMYDAFETPREVRGEIPLLDLDGAHEYLADVRERSNAVLDGALSDRDLDLDLVELVLRHELQHTETMRQAMSLGGLLPESDPPSRRLSTTERWLSFPAGATTIGAGPDGFAYDNERPRHDRTLDAFQIARRPVTNATWLRFAEGGGYVRREWWSDEGWAWKEEYDIGRDPRVAAAPAEAPVCHVSWFEADAFARSCGARLPTEFEWERASTSGQLDGTGHVWEWTSSPFAAYPGFTAYPYPEYSEVFFGPDYRVLRGGCWATHSRVASPTFRNWDLPQRRQIFSGLRLARSSPEET